MSGTYIASKVPMLRQEDVVRVELAVQRLQQICHDHFVCQYTRVPGSHVSPTRVSG